MQIISGREVNVRGFETRDRAINVMSALVGDNFKINKGTTGWFATYEKEVHTVMDGECTTVEGSEPTDYLGDDVKDSPQVEQ